MLLWPTGFPSSNSFSLCQHDHEYSAPSQPVHNAPEEGRGALWLHLCSATGWHLNPRLLISFDYLILYIYNIIFLNPKGSTFSISAPPEKHTDLPPTFLALHHLPARGPGGSQLSVLCPPPIPQTPQPPGLPHPGARPPAALPAPPAEFRPVPARDCPDGDTKDLGCRGVGGRGVGSAGRSGLGPAPGPPPARKP